MDTHSPHGIQHTRTRKIHIDIQATYRNLGNRRYTSGYIRTRQKKNQKNPPKNLYFDKVDFIIEQANAHDIGQKTNPYTKGLP